jgi:hypothetical protein
LLVFRRVIADRDVSYYRLFPLIKKSCPQNGHTNFGPLIGVRSAKVTWTSASIRSRRSKTSATTPHG